MHIEWVKLKGFRNFHDCKIHFREKTLVIGANDVGKTNLLYALRLIFDPNLSDPELQPERSDFHVRRGGLFTNKRPDDQLEIIVKLASVTEDAVLCVLKGNVSDDGDTYIAYRASLDALEAEFFIGASEVTMEKVASRYYLRYLKLKYVKSQRDLYNFVRSEKRDLLKHSKNERSLEQKEKDDAKEILVTEKLDEINNEIRELCYVRDATSALNEELHALAYHHHDMEVRLETAATDIDQFIARLELGISTAGCRIGMGGDGRNNQILMALWKAKSEKDHDFNSEVVIYCIEEPEAHLHPHQQRKIAEYLNKNLGGQTIVTTHSPQITAEFRPDSIVRLMEKKCRTTAASDGCSNCVEEAWFKFGYRMSIIPAEAFFADAVLLVEGPSEVQFYHALAKQLPVDLDYFNISILSVNGIDFEVYVKILDAFEIPWALRTDNDVFKIPKSRPPKWRLAGLNRCLKLAETEKSLRNVDKLLSPEDLEKLRRTVLDHTESKGVFVARRDLEHDLLETLPEEMMEYCDSESKQEAIEFFQSRKAINMCSFLSNFSDSLKQLVDDDLAKPLWFCKKKVEESR